MPMFDSGFKVVARASGRDQAEVAGVSFSRLQPIVSEVQISERFADRAFRATWQGQRCVLYFEAYSSWPRDALWNVQAKAGLLSEREKLPAVAILYLLTRRRYRPLDGEFLLQVGHQKTQALWYHPVRLWEQKPADWWRVCPGLMAMFPLTDHGQSGREATRAAAAAIREVVPEPGPQSDLLTSLAFFGQMAYPQLDLLGLIGRELMNESKLFRKLFGAELDQAVQQVRQQELRDLVLENLEARFGPIAPASLASNLNAISDMTTLRSLHRTAAVCETLDKFREALSKS